MPPRPVRTYQHGDGAPVTLSILRPDPQSCSAQHPWPLATPPLEHRADRPTSRKARISERRSPAKGSRRSTGVMTGSVSPFGPLPMSPGAPEIVGQPPAFSNRMISLAGMRAGSRTTKRVTPQRSSNLCSCETISSGEPIHTKGDPRTSLLEAPGMIFAISPARVPASSVSSTCWTSASMLGVRLAESAAFRIRPNVESKVSGLQMASWESPSVNVFPSPVAPTISEESDGALELVKQDQTTPRAHQPGMALAGCGTAATAEAVCPLTPRHLTDTPDCGSRMTGDRHVRFCESESGRGRFPPATHQVLPRQAADELDGLGGKCWSPGPTVRIGPASLDEATMPVEDRLRHD